MCRQTVMLGEEFIQVRLVCGWPYFTQRRADGRARPADDDEAGRDIQLLQLADSSRVEAGRTCHREHDGSARAERVMTGHVRSHLGASDLY